MRALLFDEDTRHQLNWATLSRICLPNVTCDTPQCSILRAHDAADPIVFVSVRAAFQGPLNHIVTKRVLQYAAITPSERERRRPAPTRWRALRVGPSALTLHELCQSSHVAATSRVDGRAFSPWLLLRLLELGALIARPQ